MTILLGQSTMLNEIVTNPLMVSAIATSLLVGLAILALWPFLRDTTSVVPTGKKKEPKKQRQPAQVLQFRRKIFHSSDEVEHAAPIVVAKNPSFNFRTPFKTAERATPEHLTSVSDRPTLTLDEQIARLKTIMETGQKRAEQVAHLHNKAQIKLLSAEYRLNGIMNTCRDYLTVSSKTEEAPITLPQFTIVQNTPA